MPQVPVYEGNRVEQRGLPSNAVRSDAPIGAFGGGQALEGAIGAAQDFISKERERADRLAIQDADNQLSELENRLQFDPKTGVMNKRGRDVFELPDMVQAEWKKSHDEIAKRLVGTRQKDEFSMRSKERLTSLMGNVNRHMSAEIKKYDEEVTGTTISTERNAAALNAMNPERIALSIDRQRMAIFDHADRNGWSKEQVSEKVSQAESKTHRAVIEQMLSLGDDRRAKAYFDANKKSIYLADDIEALNKSLEEGSIRGESQRLSDSITSEAETLSEAMSRVRKVDDPKLRDAVESRVRHEWDIKKAIETEDRNNLYLGAVNVIDSNPGQSARFVVPAATWAKLTTEQRDALDRRSSNPKNDDAAWLDFLDKYKADPNAVGSMPRGDFEVQFWSKFDKEHRSRAETMWREAAHARMTGKNEPVQATLSFDDRVRNTLVKSKLVDDVPRSKIKGAKERLYIRAEQKAAVAVDEFTRNNKRKPTQEEMQTLIDGAIFEEATVSGLFGSSKKPVVALDQGADVEVPETMRNDISGWFKKRGREPKEQDIRNAYIAFLQNDKQAMKKILAGE